MKYFLLMILLVLFMGCATKTEVVPHVYPIIPPTVYLEETPEPKLSGKTNDALAKYIFKLRVALKSANEDKRKILEWVQEQLNEYETQTHEKN
jgi:hypothetical protein